MLWSGGDLLEKEEGEEGKKEEEEEEKQEEGSWLYGGCSGSGIGRWGNEDGAEMGELVSQ